MKILLLLSSMPCESGISSLIKPMMNQKSHFDVKIMTVFEAKSKSKFEDVLKQNVPRDGPSIVLMVGDYWLAADLKAVSGDYLSKASFHMYCFGSCPPSEEFPPNVFFTSGNANNMGPITWTLKELCLLDRESIDSGLAQFYLKQHSEAIRMMEDRALGRNILENQVFLTGICNIGTLEMTVVEKFDMYFLGKITFDYVMKNGSIIIGSQLVMTHDRVVNNSKIVNLTLENGKDIKAVLTEGPDLINMTHTSLQSKYPEAQVTIVLGMKFSENNDEISYSFRAVDKTVNVETIAQKINGGGAPDSAGGRVSFNLYLP
jgi:hypothetical protein